MYQFYNQKTLLTGPKNNAKTITELVGNQTNHDPILDKSLKEVNVTKDMSIWEVRAAAGWPNYSGNVTDPMIINYLKNNSKYAGVWDTKTWKIIKSGKIKVPSYKGYLDNRTDIGGTALIIYGSGKSSPKETDGLGDSLKDNATKKAEILKKSKNYDDVILKECFTEDEFIEAVNLSYKSGAISLLEVFSHGSDNSIVLGGRHDPKNGEYLDTNKNRDKRLFSKVDNTNTGTIKEIGRIHPNNFRKDSRVILWGCRQAGGDYKKEREGSHGYDAVPVPASFAQGLANHLNVPVQGFFNTSRIPEKKVNGKMKTHTPGYMSPEANAHTEIVMPQPKK